MTRIKRKFKEIKAQSKIAFMPFLVAGDPDFETSILIARKILPFTDFLEIGFPYSDPLADGPTIQTADGRALYAGMHTDRIFAYIKKLREFTDIPIVVLVYANIVYQRGITRFYKDAKVAGIDGVLIPDMPVEESKPFVNASRIAGIDPIFLVASTTTPQRLKKILRHAKGFLYVVSVLGVTGARDFLSPGMSQFLKRIKQQADIPLAVGFGISKKEHITLLKKQGADGAIVGSALVSIIERNLNHRKRLFDQLIKYVEELTKT
ncbi:tryptophan synthase subunit alpha [Candidatus Peribacteria bacterium RIFCSPHIGHO2_01_FULL_49_38]|nr:MAG: tryptophan synthase subunit alpha [Candidatus Peribacteria bacterium RIFCSPHIGHO2_01_FULL_49_38]